MDWLPRPAIDTASYWLELVPFEGLLIKLPKWLCKLLFPVPKCWYQQDIGLPTVLKKPLCGCRLWIWLLNCYVKWALLSLAWLSSGEALGLWLLKPWAAVLCRLLWERLGSVRATPPPKQTLLSFNKAMLVTVLYYSGPWCICVSGKCLASSLGEAFLFCLVIPGLCRWFIVSGLLCSYRPGTLHHDLIFLP